MRIARFGLTQMPSRQSFTASCQGQNQVFARAIGEDFSDRGELEPQALRLMGTHGAFGSCGTAGNYGMKAATDS